MWYDDIKMEGFGWISGRGADLETVLNFSQMSDEMSVKMNWWTGLLNTDMPIIFKH
jgi:hypothetical protein